MTVVGCQPPKKKALTAEGQNNTLFIIQPEMLHPTAAILIGLYPVSTQTKVFVVCDGKNKLYLIRATDLWFWRT